MTKSYALNVSALKVWLERPGVSVCRSLFNTQKSVSGWEGSDGKSGY